MSTSCKIQTIPFKIVDNLVLHLDLYLPDNSPASSSGYPVIFNFHPGGSMCGDRSLVNPVMLEHGIERNWALVSFDYRLAPECTIPEIWSDCDDAWRWLHNDANDFLGGNVLDTSRVAAIGDYLALLSGYKFSPRPTVIFDIWGISEIADPFYCQPKELSDPEDEIPYVVYKTALSDTPIIASQLYDGAKFIPEPRASLYVYMIQKGIWTQDVIGLDPNVEEDSKKLLEWTPAINIDSEYPPTYVIHSDVSKAVPLKDSINVVEALKKNGVVHEFAIVSGFSRSFYAKFMTPRFPPWERTVEQAYIFLGKYLSPNI